ncbi:THI80 [Candida margitis]|uniref:THI80 n=1 Tax=Candida margitis TaxID=1775924 RepID=UPI00222740B1|nr:THI80 [Candida margitis]KAI5967908.1 THI80 [Candida margitis]
MSEPEEVIERPDTVIVNPPTCEYHTIMPFAFLTSVKECERIHNALLISNQSFKTDLKAVWIHCGLVVCSDGGANRLHDYFSNDKEREDYLPNYIVGDFDSLRDDVKSFYQSRGVKIIQQYGQYSNDFQKSIRCIQLHFLLSEQGKAWPHIDKDDGLREIWENEIGGTSNIQIHVYALSVIGGRFDQTIQSINQLYILHQKEPNLHVFFITNDDLIFLLYKGVNYVSYPNRAIFCKDTSSPPLCGLLPLGDKPVVLNSFGFRYDVKNWVTQIMGKISSSNRVAVNQSTIRFASSYIPPRSPVLSSLAPLSFASSKPTSILQTPNLIPRTNEVTLKLPSLTQSSSFPSPHPVKEQHIAIEVEIVGDEIKFEIVDAGDSSNTMHADSVLRKRRLKMKKHKYKKRRKAQRALRKRLGK